MSERLVQGAQVRVEGTRLAGTVLAHSGTRVTVRIAGEPSVIHRDLLTLLPDDHEGHPLVLSVDVDGLGFSCGTCGGSLASLGLLARPPRRWGRGVALPPFGAR